MVILDEYFISQKTKSVTIEFNVNYFSRVTELGDKEYYVRQTPLEIIAESCMKDWTTYDGRRQIITLKTPYKHNVPIPTHLEKQIIVVPTKSPKRDDCAWLNPIHVTHTSEKITTKGKHVKVHFSDKTSLILNDTSQYTVMEQIKRGHHCRNIIWK